MSERLSMPVMQVLQMPWDELEAELAFELAYRAHVQMSLPTGGKDDVVSGIVRAVTLPAIVELAKLG